MNIIPGGIMKQLICLIIVVFLLVSCQGEKSSTAFFEEGKKLFNQQKYDDAIAKYKEGIALSPKSAVGYNLLGMAYRVKYTAVTDVSLKELEIDAFKTSIECDSTFWVAYINLGATYFYAGKKKEAVPLFEKALMLNPEHHEKEKIQKMIEEGRLEEEGD
jgi:tetratricopeptide (TPR) repeat protein